MKKLWNDYALGIILFGLFLGSWLAQFGSQVAEVANQAAEHGSQFQWSEFWPQFFTATFENWQSEFLQLFTFVVLSKYFLFRDSPQSREGSDRIESKIDKLLRK